MLNGIQLSPSFSLLGEPFSVVVKPRPLKDARLAAVNTELLAEFGVEDNEQTRAQLLTLFSGNETLADYPARAAVYSGHQFGVYVPQLGDGRALLYAEVLNKQGQRHQWQLKGGGLTPYSRMGDGRAVLRSTIREYLCSEAMHHLGIPTTRSLCLVHSQEPVYRETPETGATMVRVAPSFIRFGSFQFFAHSNQHEALTRLLDFTVQEHFPEWSELSLSVEQKAVHLLATTVKTTALMLAQWQAVGFAHGVMNTDNMSVLGLTLDYGPFGFLDAFDPHFICNHSDHSGRYAFDEQPSVAFWNLCRFAESLLPLANKELLGEPLATFEAQIVAEYARLMRAKLGFNEAQADDRQLFTQWQQLMAENAADYTRSFRALSNVNLQSDDTEQQLLNEFADRDSVKAWLAQWRERLAQEASTDLARQAQMKRTNPKYVLRNYLAQQAISQAEAGDFTEFERLHDLLRRPFDEQSENEHYAALPPDWGRGLEISCSS